ncbi:hypothetical protein Y717_25195 [Streptomyces scopuliridis RB72]|uniref:Uncharacterized protein n=1 Tax=Streptomyces scopuliridis RB72 TaxID=1440053 RepID=A0A2T7TG58_9ACTN|nr:hypothetical protein Y717_25195 [Streptomyces scopuliridis RB72]
MARAFDDDPMLRWFFPDDSSREASLVSYFTTIFTRQYVHNAVCESGGTQKAVAASVLRSNSTSVRTVADGSSTAMAAVVSSS